MIPNHLVHLAHALVAITLLAACGNDDTNTNDDAVDALDSADSDDTIPDLTGKSAYKVVIVVDGEEFDLPLRDLTGDPKYFAFGSTHIAPAVSFAMTDTVTFPRTINFTLDFGIVVPSEERPLTTDGPGTYPVSATQPSAIVFIKGLQYRSTNAGSTGAIVVTEWATETGGVVSGTFEATLVADGPTGKTASIKGYYHFILPEKESGQPG